MEGCLKANFTTKISVHLEQQNQYLLSLFVFFQMSKSETRNKREKDSIRDDRDYDSELLSRDARSDRDARESRDRRDARERGRETTRDSRDNRDAKDSRESRTDNRSSRESLGSRERERDRDREKDREREKERERDPQRKDDTTQEDRSYGRGHGREDTKGDRAEKNGRVRSRANESSDKGKNDDF